MPAEVILIIEYDPDIVRLVRQYLEREGFRVKSAANGQAGLVEVDRENPTLVILDAVLPDMDGYEVCRSIREVHNQVPVLLFTAPRQDPEKILALGLEADDYLSKPFNPREVAARVKGILRRSRYTPGTAAAVVHAGDLAVDPSIREVRCAGRLVDLRTLEFEVLHTLLSHRGQILTPGQVLNLAWGFDFPGQTIAVDVHIASIRRKLAGSRVRIESVNGSGYRLVS